MRRLFPLYLVIFVGFLAYSIQIPIFTALLLAPDFGPVFFPHGSHGIKRLILGILLSMYPLGQFLGSPIMGALSDRLGRKKMLVFTLTMTTLMTLLCAYTISKFAIGILHIVLFFTGLFEGNIAIAQGAIVDSVDDDNRSRYFGYIYVCSSLGFVFGPLLASLFSNPKIIPWFGPATTFWVMGILLLALTIWIGAHFKETHITCEIKKRGYFEEFSNLANIFRDKHLRYYYGVNFLLYLSAFGFLRIYSTYLLLKFHIEFGLLSLIVAYVGLPFILVNIFIIPLLSKLKSPKKITLVFSIFMGISMMSVSFFNNFNSIWFTLGITTAALAIAITFSVSMISFMADREKQGAVLGDNQSLVSGAQGVSAIVGGLFAMITIYLPLIAFGILGVLAGILLLRRHHSNWQIDHHHSSKPAVIDEEEF